MWKKYKTDDSPYGRHGPENPNHYADMDFRDPGGKTLDDHTPSAASLSTKAWADYYRSVGWNAVSQRGLLPFRVWQIYKAMTVFVAAGKVASFVAAAGVLAHYVGDACQPLHTSYLDDGDPFRTPAGDAVTEPLGHGKGYGHGVHMGYENDMVDDFAGTLIKDLQKALPSPHTMPTVTGGQEAGYAVIELARRARAGIAPIDLVEAYASILKTKAPKDRSAALWAKFGAKTVDTMADGCRVLAMLWDSAWHEGNGPAIDHSHLKVIGKKELQGIYEKQDFLPSKALGKIDPYL